MCIRDRFYTNSIGRKIQQCPDKLCDAGGDPDISPKMCIRDSAKAMQAAGASLRGRGGIRYIYYQGEVKQLVESSHKEVRVERSFTILELSLIHI